MRKIKAAKRIAACLTALVLTAGALAGCGKDNADVVIREDEKNPGTVTEEEEQGTAMGRFVESKIALYENSLTDWNSRLFRQEDGSLLLADNSGFVLRSTDKGESWTREEFPWLTRLSDEGKWIMSMAIGPDRTAAVVWTEPMDDSGSDIDMKLLLVLPDNTEIPVEIALAEDDMWINAVYTSDTGRIFVNAGGSNLYEVKEDGSSEVFLTVEGGLPDLVQFHGSLMLIDGRGLDVPLIYDMEKQEFIEDEVLAEFVTENFNTRECYTGKYYDLFLTSGGDDAIYTIGHQGVYRHVLGGSAMEQVIDGNLSVLNNPVNSIMDVLVVDHDVFLVLFTGGELVRFVYDPNVPARPNEKLAVWSLKDEPVIRQAISLYQMKNPEIYVEYEVGLEGNAATREDVIKNLNTRMMAGEGPDVLILDNMPMDSYIEKGILMDIGPLLSGLHEEEALFPNVEEAFREDGHIYAIPCMIQLPYLFGWSEDLNQMTDILGIADTMEEMRKDHPGSSLLQIPSAKGIMRIFAMTSAPAWRTEDGTIDTEAVSDFLIQSKRMYEAETDGLMEDLIQYWEEEKAVYQYYSAFGETLEGSDEIRNQGAGGYFLGNMRQFIAGSIKNVGDYNYYTSLMETEGYTDCIFIPMKGQCENMFWARTLVGINATSGNPERAQDFLKTALGSEVQADMENGLPVNQKAILDSYEEQWRIYKDNDYISGSASFGDFNESKGYFLIQIPDEEKVNELIAWIASMDAAYVEDKTFENVIYEEGEAYIQGEKSLDEAMEAIETRLGIYLTE